MAVNIPSSARLQPSDQANMDESSTRGISVTWKGPYGELMTAASGISPGDALPSPYSSWFAKTWSTQKTNGGYGTLTVNAVPGDQVSTPEPGGSPSTVPLRDTYSLKSVRNDVSILGYCGPSEGSNPYRPLIEKWMKESDAELAGEFCFRQKDGSIYNIADERPVTKRLIDKMLRGVESVIRFYPQVTRKRIYYAPPIGLFDKLGFVDTPPSPDTLTLAPDGITRVIDAHEWLKVQDDCDEQTDGKWARTESWLGILKTDSNQGHPWDPDLYGEDRWPMPYATA